MLIIGAVGDSHTSATLFEADARCLWEAICFEEVVLEHDRAPASTNTPDAEDGRVEVVVEDVVETVANKTLTGVRLEYLLEDLGGKVIDVRHGRAKCLIYILCSP